MSLDYGLQYYYIYLYLCSVLTGYHVCLTYAKVYWYSPSHPH